MRRVVARQTWAARRQRARGVAAALGAHYPRSMCALVHESPWQLLVATVLSAQTTDAAVNQATRVLFARWPTPAALGEADPGEVGAAIASIGLWRRKAHSIVGLSRAIHEDHAGQVPQTLGALVALPGVGRKTATAVLGTAFGVSAGVTVDTHMLRINRLLGLSAATVPERMARDLERLLEPEAWTSYTHRIIDHGRIVCVARRPRCGVCPVRDLCPSAFDPEAGYRPANDAKTPASARQASWLAWPVPSR